MKLRVIIFLCLLSQIPVYGQVFFDVDVSVFITPNTLSTSTEDSIKVNYIETYDNLNRKLSRVENTTHRRKKSLFFWDVRNRVIAHEIYVNDVLNTSHSYIYKDN